MSRSLISTPLKFIVPTLFIALLTACDNPDNHSQQTTASDLPPASSNVLPADHPPMGTQTAQLDLANLQGGLVKESFNNGGYTYVKVERNGQEFWAAGPENQLAQGDLVAWQQSTVMKNFTSKSLNKTFEQIHFVSQFIDPAQQQQQAVMQASNEHAAVPSGTGGIIKEVLVSGGYTYVKVAINGNDVWAAGPSMQLAVGETVMWTDGSKMTNFTSTTLDKTFSEIYFVGSFNKNMTTEQNQPSQASTPGAVAEVFSSAGYSYLKVNINNKQVWLAAPESDVKEQDRITWLGGSVMHNFESRTLDRTFEEIIFVDRIKVLSN